MSIRTRWQSSATRWRLDNGRVRVSNAWYRAVGRRISGGRQRYRNWLNRRARVRGRAPLPDRLTRCIGSRLPVVRDRINPATGRPRWTDRSDGALARWRADHGTYRENELLRARVSRESAAINARAGMASIPARTPQSGRAAGNREHVRTLLADRQPKLARTLDRTVRDLSPRTGRSR